MSVTRRVCRRGHDLATHGRYVDVGYASVFRCTVCRRGYMDRKNARARERRASQPREMPKLCRNGHDLAEHGEWHSTPKRPLHVRCRECRRLICRKELALRKEQRAADRARDLELHGEVCRNGHARSEHAARDKNGHWRCRKCENDAAALRAALKRGRR